ncbi:hypothetical protein AAHA92_10973 [Salvia divinorum]|uniref:Uncharacterized protein n=1 Tax=Salvia divinorum TaxID=28513 RepID=A0ABD1I0G8_SALDI
MSEAEEVKFHIKVVINKSKTKVLFAEADSDFTDVLLSFLLLPLVTIVEVLEKHYGDKAPVIGSLNTLYKGASNLDPIHFLGEDVKKDLISSTLFDSELCKLRLSICGTQPTFSSNGESYEGVFTKSSASFIITDQLFVYPNVAGSIIETLTTLGIAVKDMDGIETRNVTFGMNEIIALLKESLISLDPLTALFFSRILIVPTEGHVLLHPIYPEDILRNPKIMMLKVMLQISTNKFLFAQADADFVNFLFSNLTIPLGRVEWFLCSNTGLKNMDNLHKSVASVVDSFYLKCDKDLLIKPDPTSINLYVKKANEYYYLNMDGCENQLYVEGPRMYIVSDDLTVAPLGVTVGFSVINQFKISLSDVEEVKLNVGLKEALSILKASLTSSTALTDGLIKPFLKEQLIKPLLKK